MYGVLQIDREKLRKLCLLNKYIPKGSSFQDQVENLLSLFRVDTRIALQKVVPSLKYRQGKYDVYPPQITQNKD